MNRKTTLGFLATLALLGFILMGASNITQSFTWNSALNAFQVLLKDGGGPKFAASAKGVTDGSAAAAGMVGEVISATGNVANPNCLVGTPTTTVSITLTPGAWVVGGSTQIDNRGGVTGGESRFFVKGTGGSTYGYDLMFSTSAAAINVVPMTFSLRPVSIVAGDADKTVLIKANTNGAVSACYSHVYAVRIR